MSKVEDFLTKTEEESIVEAIRLAEKNTSGEIRVHLEKHAPKSPMDRAFEIFHVLNMDQTEARNGVLLYFAVKDKCFAIYGDTGINEKVGAAFWDSTRDKIQSHFRDNSFCKGIIAGIEEAGHQLKTHFPYSHDDRNELTNEISKG